MVPHSAPWLWRHSRRRRSRGRNQHSRGGNSRRGRWHSLPLNRWRRWEGRRRRRRRRRRRGHRLQSEAAAPAPFPLQGGRCSESLDDGGSMASDLCHCCTGAGRKEQCEQEGMAGGLGQGAGEMAKVAGWIGAGDAGRMARRRAHGIEDDETFRLNARFLRFPTTWKRRWLVSWPRNECLLSPPHFIQRFHFC